MQTNGENNYFILLKDHKENFQNNPTFRLINPAKNELGKISKVILDRINKSIWENLQFNQWKNTSSVIDLFIAIQEKHLHSFVIFDIKDFYPSIKEKLLIKALKFTDSYTFISDEDKRIINHTRKSLIFKNQQVWIKKESGLFDVTMGAYDGVEVCKLAGSFLHYQLSNKYNKRDIGLYRDVGLTVFKHKRGPQAERIKKDFQKIFGESDLNIVIKCNLKIVHYLDVILSLLNYT